MSHSRNISLFSPGQEVINLALPFFFIPLLFIEITTSHRWVSSELDLGVFLTKMVFLNGIHVIFTFPMLFLLPELRNWLGAKSKKSYVSLPTHFFAIFSLFAILNLFFPNQNSQNVASVGPWLVVFCLVVYRRYHIAAQTVGLSLIYNRKIEKNWTLSPVERSQVGRTDKWERRLAYFAFAMMIFYRMGLPATSAHPFGSAKWIFSALSFGATFCNLMLIWRLPYAKQSNKFYFALRYLFIPLSCYSTVAIWAYEAHHGIEYLFLSQKMVSNSSAQANKRLLPWLGALGVIAIYTVAMLFGLRQSSVLLADYFNPRWFSFIALFTVTTSYLHYYIDGFLFRMRDPVTRRYVLPLLQ